MDHKLEPTNGTAMGCRIGTAYCDRDMLRDLLGIEPNQGHPASKVTIGWTFNSPRGPVEIRDYWWNAEDEWSIAAANWKAGLWLNKYLRTLGIKASLYGH